MIDYGRFSVNTWRERTNQAAEARQVRIKETRAAIQQRIDDRQYLRDFAKTTQETYKQAANADDLGAYLRSLYEGKGGSFDKTG